MLLRLCCIFFLFPNQGSVLSAKNHGTDDTPGIHNENGTKQSEPVTTIFIAKGTIVKNLENIRGPVKVTYAPDPDSKEITAEKKSKPIKAQKVQETHNPPEKEIRQLTVQLNASNRNNNSFLGRASKTGGAIITVNPLHKNLSAAGNNKNFFSLAISLFTKNEAHILYDNFFIKNECLIFPQGIRPPPFI